MRDNVGSVRVVINRNKKSDGTVDVITYNDYYPYGSIARNGGVGYRYEYQGAYAEKDPVTGYNNFDLRMYDSRIGRWLSVDPMGQYASPYVGMGNEPVNGLDPTGGETKNQGIDKYGNIVFDDHKQDGNIFLVNESFKGKITSLDQLVANSTQLSKNSVWIGTDNQLKDFTKNQWQLADGGFSGFLTLMNPENLVVREPRTGSSGGYTILNYDDAGGDYIQPRTGPHDGEFIIRNGRGKPNQLFTDVYNTRNALSHEKIHLLQLLQHSHNNPGKPMFFDRSKMELESIKYQQNLPNYNKTSPNYQYGIDNYKSKFQK